MIDFSKFKGASPFLSFLIGIGMTILFFHKPYSSKKYLGIPVSKIEGRVVKHDEKCYIYRSEDVKCPAEIKKNTY